MSRVARDLSQTSPRRRAGAVFCLLILGIVGRIGGAAPPASQPSVDPALWKRLTEIDQRAAGIASMTARFEQRKFTALLRKPLVSSGSVRIRGATMRWDTEKPEPNVMLVTEKDVQLFYPAQKTVEQYPLDQRMAELAASPLPRLAVLKDRFSLEQIPATDLDKSADAAKSLALKLTPTTDDLREHVQHVKVLLDVEAGYIVQAELTDADGDRTLIHFFNIAVNTDVGDLALKVPVGTKVTKPLGGPSPGPSK